MTGGLMRLCSALSAGMKVAVAVAALSSTALGDDRLDGIRGEGARAAGWKVDDGPRGAGRGSDRGHRGRDGGRHSVPEFDPAAAGAIAALLASGALTIAHRRSR